MALRRPVAFAVDKQLVAQRIKDYQKRHHPDKFSGGEGQLQGTSAKYNIIQYGMYSLM